MTLRPATLDDAAILFAWRNDPETRRASKYTEPVTWERHEHWLAGALANQNRRLFIAEDGARRAVGTGRLDLSEDGVRADVSITVAPEWRGRGYARLLISELVKAALALGVLDCVAIIKPWNTRSLAAFTAEGFDAPPLLLRRIQTP